jgi:hypothetical protein
MADQRLATDDGQVQWSMLPDQGQNSADELISTVIGQAAQSYRTPKMVVTIGVATWTTQGTLSGQLDGQHGRAASEN